MPVLFEKVVIHKVKGNKILFSFYHFFVVKLFNLKRGYH